MLKNIITGIDLGINETFFKIRVNNPRSAWRGIAAVDCPCAAFIGPRGKERT
jgi:hypothetical protein